MSKFSSNNLKPYKMSASNFNELLRHEGHEIEVVVYAPSNMPDQVCNVSCECLTCHEVLIDFDNPE